ncbi:PEP-CTERM sorting domain-containing protein [Lacipirellula sp.]|uniref:PEP-CTERM sorting domain-containing protein n=1 Tax=Lacipirellula sp. TaxID=2691419 RepID=UPI003D0B6CB8
MRPSLLVLSALFAFLNLPTASAQAPAYAEYNPATGDVRVKGMSGPRLTSFHIFSASSLFDVNYSIASIDFFPSQPLIPQYLRMTPRETFVLWPREFNLDSVLLRGLVPPGTPIEELSYYDPYNAVALRKGTIIQVPEPATTVLLLCGLTALASVRRCSRQVA